MNWRFKPQSEKFTGFLDLGTSFTGELSFEGTFRIDGEFHGSIVTKDILVVGPRATIYADIKAGEARIHGSVFGNVSGNRRIEIGATGKVRGDVQAPQLVIEEGAVFEGRSHAVVQDVTQLEMRAADEETVAAQDPIQINRKLAESRRREPRNEDEPSNDQKDGSSGEKANSNGGGDQAPPRPTPDVAEKKRWAQGIL